MTVLALLLVMLATPPPAPADTSAVAEAVSAAFAEAWPDAAPRATVRVVRLSASVARATPPVRVRFAGSAAVPRGRASVEVEVRTDAGWTRAGWALVEVAHTETVAVLARPVARGATLTPADYLVEVAETTRLAEAPLAPDTLAAAPWIATRPLAAGTVLTRRHVAPPLAVRTGDAVRVDYARGAVRVAFEGVARERGAVGDAVRVYDASTRRTHRVRLTAPAADAAPAAAVWLSTL